MKTSKAFLVMVLIGCLVAITPLPASAEWMADLYLGIASTSDGDFTTTAGGISVSGETQFETSFAVGGRVGYWFEGLPWLGVALDVSWFQPNEDVAVLPVDIRVIPLSALLMARLSLNQTNEFPKGRLQPYLAIGPGMFRTHIEEEVTGFSDTSTDYGLDFRAGATWLLQRNLGLFAEYRFTSVTPEVEGRILGVPVAIEFDLDTHAFNVGLSYRF